MSPRSFGHKQRTKLLYQRWISECSNTKSICSFGHSPVVLCCCTLGTACLCLCLRCAYCNHHIVCVISRCYGIHSMVQRCEKGALRRGGGGRRKKRPRYDVVLEIPFLVFCGLMACFWGIIVVEIYLEGNIGRNPYIMSRNQETLIGGYFGKRSGAAGGDSDVPIAAGECLSLFLVAPLSVTLPFHSYSQDSTATASESDCRLGRWEKLERNVTEIGRYVVHRMESATRTMTPIVLIVDGLQKKTSSCPEESLSYCCEKEEKGGPGCPCGLWLDCW